MLVFVSKFVQLDLMTHSRYCLCCLLVCKRFKEVDWFNWAIPWQQRLTQGLVFCVDPAVACVCQCGKLIDKFVVGTSPPL